MGQRRSGAGSRRAGAVALAGALAGLAAGAAIAGCAHHSATPARTAEARQDEAGLVRGPGAARWDFSAPDAIAVAGGRVWVADQGDNAVYELSARTGALIRVISGPGDRISGPDALAADQASVWVANASDNTSPSSARPPAT